jgi:hypothetical protein
VDGEAEVGRAGLKALLDGTFTIELEPLKP